MKNSNIPLLCNDEISVNMSVAKNSPRKRHALILHKKGDYFNHVFNFMCAESYMQTHMHPGTEKIEYIHIVTGIVAVIYFDDNAMVTKVTVLGDGHNKFIAVPAFVWHTYVILSEYAITYETMDGVYHPDTWKRLAEWAPQENTPSSIGYLSALKSLAAI